MTGRMGVPMPGMGAGPSLSKIMFDKYDKVNGHARAGRATGTCARANAGSIDDTRWLGGVRTTAARST